MRPFLLGLLLTLSLSAEAKLFTNSYVSFELPPNWDCSREGTEWLCVSQFEKSQKKEAIIILTAKEAGAADSLDQYMAHLKTPRMLPNKSGPPIASKLLHAQQRIINNHPWVDGLHQGSEVSTYYTRYLGTVKERVAILVTFSAHRNSYTKYSQDFIRAVDSLRVTATKDLIGKTPTAGIARPSETIGQPIPPGMAGLDAIPEEDSSGSSQSLRKLLGLGLIVAAVGTFLLLRSRKSKSKSRKRR